MMWRILLLLMLIPAAAMAQCVQWLECPFRVGADSRRIELPQGSRWKLVEEIPGDLGIVCTHQMILPPQLSSSGCVVNSQATALGKLNPNPSDNAIRAMLILLGTIGETRRRPVTPPGQGQGQGPP